MKKVTSYEKQVQQLETRIKNMHQSRYTNAYANKYKITFRAKKQMDSFIERAVTHNGWSGRILDHAKETVISEAKRISHWAMNKGREIFTGIQREKQQLENWWQQVMSEPEPPEPDNLILIV